jgi:7-carboxy-7-deazaguanine synthase
MAAQPTTPLADRLRPLEALRGRESTHLLINEIYASIQGESTHAGRPCVFIRTAACNQRCNYCDTAYAFTGGEALHIDEVVDRALSCGIPLVELTGGEPLLQPLLPELCRRLLDAGCEVLLETGGSHDISPVPEGVCRILDLKTPGSGEETANDYGNLGRLRRGDEVKFVLTSREDYDWATGLVRRERLADRTTVLYAPAWGRVDAAELAGWILSDRLEVRLNVQLHKYVWGAARRGV